MAERAPTLKQTILFAATASRPSAAAITWQASTDWREHVDIHMGNHVWNNDTDQKLKILNDDPDGPNPFLDPTDWGRFLATRRAAAEKILGETVI